MPPNCLDLKEGKVKKFQQVYVNFIIKIFGSRKTVLFASNTNLENKFSKGESMRHEI